MQAPNALALLNDAPVIAYDDFNLGVFVTRFANGAFDEAFAAIGRPSQLSFAARGSTVLLGAQDFAGR